MPITIMPIPNLPAFHLPLPLRSPSPSRASTPQRLRTCAVMKPTKPYAPEDAIRPALKSMSPYTPILPYEILAEKLGRHPSDIVKLDANENPYGPAPAVKKALADAEYFHIYPDPESIFLRDAISSYCQIHPKYILAGAGADELIDLLFRLFITPAAGDTIVNCPPTFGMYKFDADVNSCRVINVTRDDHFQVDVAAIEQLFEEQLQNPPKMLFVASPNNPDGSVISDSQLRRLLALPTLIVLDEAYFEFGHHNRLTWVPQHSNLVVLRTFSKWAGLAGMRVGYGAFPPAVIKHLWKIKQPYNVSVASQIAAIASIQDKQDLLNKVDLMKQQRDVFYDTVTRYQWLKPYPSQSNYVLCRVSGGRNAKTVKDSLANEGILIRYYTTPALSDCIRVSMGTEQQMTRLYHVLDQL